MEYTIKGLDKLNKKLKGMSGPELKKELTDTTQKALFYVHGTVPPYPAPPVGSTYKRTGTLGRGINTQVKTIGGEIAGVIGSPTVYAPWVISSKAVDEVGPQTSVHKRTGWYTLQSVVEKARKTVVDFYDKMVKRLIRR
ncbi:MAG TPA: hypothetical protein VMW53_07265 [archaeon]|nr:hypothetical protein [archaeon]